MADSIMQRFAAGDYPHLVEFATQYVLQPGYDFAAQFDFGLDLILDGLATQLENGGA
ncbi:MAG TPA: TetR/AcrR family transcriptional regulator C-terminal domain-containing protein [Propionibacteriaceae bacterium]|nr:TetR/AcrR family transcriptional regulator C-terminal domain-containing protein [Propionibacteriaceae bacterium]